MGTPQEVVQSESEQISGVNLLEERLAEAARRVAACAVNSNEAEFTAAMTDLEKLKLEAKRLMQTNNSGSDK